MHRKRNAHLKQTDSSTSRLFQRKGTRRETTMRCVVTITACSGSPSARDAAVAPGETSSGVAGCSPVSRLIGLHGSDAAVPPLEGTYGLPATHGVRAGPQQAYGSLSQ